MMKDFDYNKAIEEYLKGSISQPDKVELESRLSDDPSLKNEFDFQKDIYAAIRNERKLELKASLSGIHVPWYYMIPNGLKIVAAASIVSLAGLGAFYYFGSPSLSDSSHEILIERNNENLSNTDNKIIPVEPEDTQTNQPENIIPDTHFNKEDKKIEHKPDALTRGNQNEKNASGIPDEINIPKPNMDQTAGEIEDNSLVNEDNPKINNSTVPGNIDRNAINVKTIKNEEYQFNYSFIEGALRLYGDFSGNPYKILEINSSKGKEYYLFYNENYYFLKQNSGEIKPLEKVTDLNLVNELNILKNNK